MKKNIRVRVPGTTANLGPGFDTLGIALNFYNEIGIRLSSVPEVVLEGGLDSKPNRGAMKMIMEAARAFFRAVDADEQGITVRIDGDVPIARGCGSSVTVRMGMIAGLNELFNKPLNKNQILNLVSRLEGHPDNAAPAIYGGLVVSGMINNEVVCFRKKLPRSLKFVAAIPDYEVETKKARELLPTSIPFQDAVHNVNRTSLLVAALWDGDYEKVGDFLEDRLHQPQRAALVPQLFSCLNAAKLAGAIGGWLSGSGSTIMALTLKDPKKVGEAMRQIFAKSAVPCKILVLEADQNGLTIHQKSK
jgi:homoserine kinase